MHDSNEKRYQFSGLQCWYLSNGSVYSSKLLPYGAVNIYLSRQFHSYCLLRELTCCNFLLSSPHKSTSGFVLQHFYGCHVKDKPLVPVVTFQGETIEKSYVYLIEFSEEKRTVKNLVLMCYFIRGSSL